MKSTWLLLAPLLFAFLVSPYTIEGIFPNAGPTTGETRLTIYSPAFKGMNSTDHPNPKCQFPGNQPQLASWIHCYGSATNPSPQRDQTCLNCETPAHDAGRISIKVSINGDFTDTAEASFTFYVDPTVTYITPPLGWKTGGTFVQVHGENFGNFDQLGCGFGSVNVPATYVSPTLITCKSPAADVIGTAIPLRVTQNNQQYSTSRAHYFYHAVPEVSQLIPNEGSVAGGTEVLIVGRQMHPFEKDQGVGIDNLTFARFGPDHYVKLELINRTHARAIAPPSASPTKIPVEISFNNQDWTSNGILYSYFLSPYVVKLTPDFGIVEGGTNVTVMAANLQKTDDIKCRFGNKIVDGHYINENSVWCITPPSDRVGSQDFGLSSENNHFSSNKISFLYIKQPKISSVSPTCGPTTGLTQLTVTGENFVYTGANKVSCIFGNDIYQPATVINETLIYCDSPTVVDKFGSNINDTHQLHFRLTLNDVEIIDSKFDFIYYTMPQLTSIEPKIGPVEGGTEVIVRGDDFSKSCGVVCRFATVEVPGKVSDTDKGLITCKAPVASCPGDSIVQVSLNNQQYTTNDYDLQDTVFTQYSPPVVAYALPTSFPTGGNSSIGVYGNGFLLYKNSTTLDSGAVRLYYQCRFKDADSKKLLGVANSTYFTNFYIHCKTPQLDSPTNNVVMEISPNGQEWIPVPSEKIVFYSSPMITSIDPKFGRVKQNNEKITVTGKYFDCQDKECQVKCAFSGDSFRIVTNGTRQTSEQVICALPSLSMPAMAQVQISMNNVDFTSQKVYYTFYDAFVVNVDPAYVPVEGNGPVKVIGLGFADTPDLKVRLEDSSDSVLKCGGGNPCIIPAKFISPSELSFVIPPQANVKNANGENIGFAPIDVEVSVYGDSFTENGVQLNYFDQPKVGANLTVNQSSYTFHANAVGTIFVPITIQVPEGIKEENFLRKTRILCKYNVNGQEAVTEGKLVQYPYPTGSLDINQVSVECMIPRFDKPGTGSVSVALNGLNFVGNLPVTVIPQLTIKSLEPRCGPREGGTNLNIGVSGVQTSDLNNLFFSWSSVCTDPLTSDMLVKDNLFKTVTPAALPKDTPGGSSLIVFSAEQKIDFVDNVGTSKVRNHFESSAEFLYYRRPIITRVYPHGGIVTGGTPVTIEGAFFFEDKRFACSPKCKFGDTLVDAQVLSSVRLTCKSPAGKLGAFVPLTVTVNGQDVADSKESQSFAYINRPNIQSISPISGPASGGTMLLLTGQDFVDMSKYPDEFTCIFKPVDSSEPPKTVTASYINSTTVGCSTPGGWGAGTTTTVEISFNGIDYSSNNFKFKFYLIDKIIPLSGPSSGGNLLTITGSGLIPDIKKGNAACKLGSIISKAQSVTATKIECPIPAAPQGLDYHGRVDFYYTLDGEKWEQVVQGFTYYQQPVISEVIPKFISANGGRLRVKGDNFRANFYGSNPTCQIDETIIPAEYVNNTEINCNFESVVFNNQPNHYIQVSLNGQSYTPKTETTKLNIFKVSNIKPPAGSVDGGTQLFIEGSGFPEGTTPVCKFGGADNSIVTYGTYVNSRQVSCPTPSAPLVQGSRPLSLPLTVGFDNENYVSSNSPDTHFHYYNHPEIEDIDPREVFAGESTMFTIMAASTHTFTHPVSPGSDSDLYPQQKIMCKFGKLGATVGALIEDNKIACPSPRIKETNVDEENVQVQVAINGQDFADVPLTVKFVGTKSVNPGHSHEWYFAMILGALVLIFGVYILSREFPNQPLSQKQKMPLTAEMTRSDSQKPTETSQNPIVV